MGRMGILLPDELEKEFREVFRRHGIKRGNLTLAITEAKRTWYIISEEECYLEFLKQSQDIIRALLKKKTEEDLWEEHSAFLRDKNFVKAFSFEEPILKMLDECNFYYIKIKKNEI